jgi:hypothetical protein
LTTIYLSLTQNFLLHGIKASWCAQVFYTLDVSQYAIGANEKENFYYCINHALQKREPQLLHQLSGQVKLLCILYRMQHTQ